MEVRARNNGRAANRRHTRGTRPEALNLAWQLFNQTATLKRTLVFRCRFQRRGRRPGFDGPREPASMMKALRRSTIIEKGMKQTSTAIAHVRGSFCEAAAANRRETIDAHEYRW
jgi:hypothetical protein